MYGYTIATRIMIPEMNVYISQRTRLEGVNRSFPHYISIITQQNIMLWYSKESSH